MVYHDNGTVSGIKIAYIGGGSRGWAWGLMGDLALDGQISGEIRLFDIDMGAARQNEVVGAKIFGDAKARSVWTVKAYPTLLSALEKADFVVISIQPGTYKEMAVDVHAPEAYGIYQAVGDTVGPGGIIRALRTIPMYEEIGHGIEKECPDAWVINYTNPMSICTRSLYKAFPAIKAFGCCHEVFGTQRILANVLEELCGIAGVDHHDIHVNVKGINHFTWLDEAKYHETDLFPLYREFIEKHGAAGYDDRGHVARPANAQASVFDNANLIKFDLFLRYGLIAAAGDRHLAEFCPQWYIRDLKTVRAWNYYLTPVSFRESELEERNARARRVAGGQEEAPVKPSGEEGVRQMKALMGLGDMLTNVNLPNRGQISSLPMEAVVETNAHFSRDSIRPVIAGPLPDAVNALVYRHVINQEMTAQAGFQRDLKLAFTAFINDPLVALGLADARALFNTMIEGTRVYLPGYGI